MNIESEARIQQSIFTYFKSQFADTELFIYVPNDNKQKAVNLGLCPGASDLIITVNKKIYFVEVKRPKGVKSEKQKKFENLVRSLGYEYFIVRSLDEFKELIQKLKQCQQDQKNQHP